MTEDKSNPLVSQRATINLYRKAAGLLYRRFLWDLRLESWRSRKKIKAWKNKYPNKKAVILCNGPSLLDTDFSLLEGVFTFGLNKINLLFDKKAFRPSCIVAVNTLVIEQNQEFFNESRIPLFLDSKGLCYVRPRDNIAYMPSSPYREFSKDCSMNVYQGYTVTFVAMQLAFHMGFEEVALVGCDHNFAVAGVANKTVVSGVEDKSHFDPNYFAGGAKWQLPDLFESEVSYTMAKNMYEAYGRKIVNCTINGKLDIYERQELKSFLFNSGASLS